VSLSTLGVFHVALATFAVAAALLLWRRARDNGWVRALTWDCGYALPTPRMQYTAASFAGIITEWFDWILRPVRHENRAVDTLPQQASLTGHTPETVLEHVIAPASAVVMRISKATRSLQHGRVHAYLLYLLLGLAGLAGVVVFGGARAP